MGILLGKKNKKIPTYMYLPYFSVARYVNTIIFFGPYAALLGGWNTALDAIMLTDGYTLYIMSTHALAHVVCSRTCSCTYSPNKRNTLICAQ